MVAADLLQSDKDVPLEVGDRVKLCGLQSAAGASLNGLVGTLVEFHSDRGRWSVMIDGDQDAKLVRGDNIVKIEIVEPSARDPDSGEESGSDCEEQSTSDSVEKAESSSCSLSQPKRPRASSADSGLLRRQDVLAAKLEEVIGQWRRDSRQWQAAFEGLQRKCAVIEQENVNLRDALEAAESGPSMSARYVARLARQNWRLGRDIAEYENSRTQASSRPSTGNDSGPGDAEPRQEPSSPDSGRGRRPHGVRRLPLGGGDRGQHAKPLLERECCDESLSSDTTDAEETCDGEARRPDARVMPIGADARRLRSRGDAREGIGTEKGAEGKLSIEVILACLAMTLPAGMVLLQHFFNGAMESEF